MKRYCKNCKKISEAELQLKFCSHCGEPFEPVGGQSPEPAKDMLPVIPMAQAHTGGEKSQDEKYCAWEDKARLGFFGALYETWKECLFNPTKFYRRMSVTGGIGNPLLYGIILGMIGVVFSLMYNQLMGQVFDISNWYDQFGHGMQSEFNEFYELSNQIQSVGMLIQLLLSPIFITIGLFITSGMFHLILLIFGWSKAGFEGTFRIVSYNQSALFFYVIPVLGGIIVIVWSLILQIIGLKEVHKLSVGKAILVLILPITLFCLCCCGFFLMIFSMAGFSNL